MRIISGIRRGLILESPENENIRPTIDRIKEAMFSIIQFDLGEIVLDLFAGTGQLGIEAISRGAKHVIFCDSDQKSIELIKRNLNKAKFTEFATVINSDWKSALNNISKNIKINTVLLDPPFESKIHENVIMYLQNKDLLQENALIIVECKKAEQLPEQIGNCKLLKKYNYGQVSLNLYKFE